MFDFKPTTHYIINTRKCQTLHTNKAFNSLSFRGKRGYTVKSKKTISADLLATRGADLQNTIQNKMTQNRMGKTFGGILTHKNEETRYALVQGRATGKWSFPKGHSNPDEEPLACAKREIAEETSIEQLPEPTNHIKMGYGHYYLFELTEQLPLIARDTAEVMDTMWATLEEMSRLQLNADASLFVKKNALNNKGIVEDAECQNR